MISAGIVNIFVPTTPNPTSGFLLMVPKKDLINGKSLLAAGIKKVSGKFNKGDHIKIIDIKSNEFARGLSSFSSDEIAKIIGCHSNEIKKILGYISKSEVVHKDDMVKI